MLQAIQATAQTTYWLNPEQEMFLLIHILGIACFAYIVWKRLTPLLRGERDFRFDRPWLRFERLLKFWLGQWKHPRYMTAGIIHIFIFAGFLVLAIRAFDLLILGFNENFVIPGLPGRVSYLYGVTTDYAATIVFLAVIVAVIRRVVFKPVRYAVPAKYGKAHTADAIFLLALIAILMVADSLFEATKARRSFSGRPGRSICLYPVAAVVVEECARLRFVIDTQQSPRGSLISPRSDILPVAVLPAVWNPVPRGDLAVQYLFRKAGPGNCKAREVGSLR